MSQSLDKSIFGKNMRLGTELYVDLHEVAQLQADQIRVCGRRNVVPYSGHVP